MPRQPWFMDVLADEFRGSKGFRVDVYPGWEWRGSTSFDPSHVMDHHTGGGAYNNLLRYMAEGPVHPPLCNYATSRVHSRVVRITIVAAGRANHAGKGRYTTIPLDQGNRYSFGGEHQNDGYQAWPAQQVEAIRRCDAALLRAMKRDTDRMLDHKTYAPIRKSDRHSTNVETERIEVQRLMRPSPPPDPLEEFMSSLSKTQRDRLMHLASLSDKQFDAVISFAEQVERLDSSGRGVVSATVHDSRSRTAAKFDQGDPDEYRDSDYEKLSAFLRAIEEMDSSPQGVGKHMIALIRLARALGLRIDPDLVSENRIHTAEELGFEPLIK